MRLHDLPLTAAPAQPTLADRLRLEDLYDARERMRERDLRWGLGLEPLPIFRPEPVRPQADPLMVNGILRELHIQAHELGYMRHARPEDNPRLCIVIKREEWRALQYGLPWFDLERNGFAAPEGGNIYDLTFQGWPVVLR